MTPEWDIKAAMQHEIASKDSALISKLKNNSISRAKLVGGCPTVEAMMKGKTHDHTTLVTAYFQMESKYPSSNYIKWMDNFFHLISPVVIFTNVPKIIRQASVNKPGGPSTVRIIETTLENTTMYMKHFKALEKTEDLDPERGIHPPKLYVVWNNKPFFVEEAIDINPFGSKYYFWVDIGSQRQPATKIKYWPLEEMMELTHDRVLFNNIQPFQDKDLAPEGWKALVRSENVFDRCPLNCVKVLNVNAHIRVLKIIHIRRQAQITAHERQNDE